MPYFISIHAFIDVVLGEDFVMYIALVKALFKWFAKGRYVPEALELQEKVGGAKGF